MLPLWISIVSFAIAKRKTNSDKNRGGSSEAGKGADSCIREGKPRIYQVSSLSFCAAHSTNINRVPKVTGHYCDVSSEESVNAVIAEVIEQHGKVDNLVTSAGFCENFNAIDYPIDRIRKLWGVNVDGTYLFAVGVAKHLMERKAPGAMVFIGSMSGAIVNVPQPQAPYNASKAAVRHLASSLAVEWANDGIRVNTISPGYMLTAL